MSYIDPPTTPAMHPVQPASPPSPQPPPPLKRPSLRQFIVPAVVAGALVAVGIAGIVTSSSTEPDAPPTQTSTTLELAQEACAAGELGDGGRTIVLDMEGDDYGGALTFDEVTCVLGVVGVPTSVASRMDATRALDGMQDAEWDGFSATWTYHPDDGLDVIVTEN